MPHELKQKQSLPLDVKIRMSKLRIKEWYEYFDGKVYVSFSGGKDSTVLLHLVRSLYPDVVGVFADTGLEYPEIREFVKSIDNIVWVRPNKPFTKVIEEHGYPIVSKDVATQIYEIRNTKSEYLLNKRMYGDNNGNGKLAKKWKYLIDSDIKISSYCCNVMKKLPFKRYQTKSGNKPIVGTMAHESRLRQTHYLIKGCNAFDTKSPMSTPLSFWLEHDIWDYLHKFNVPYSRIYDMGYDRTGCMFCMFGVHMEKGENRFQRMKRTHPNQWNYCINKLGIGHCLDLINVEYNEYIEPETQAEICLTQEED